MIQFVCESCGKIKDPKENWILGLAADTLGITSVSREVTILEPWDAKRAVDPLAVHFCSIACKDRYVGQLFAAEPPAKVPRKKISNSARAQVISGGRSDRKPAGSRTRQRKRAA